jgi:nicotinamide mononucleotide (NMN) deamidase PncC
MPELSTQALIERVHASGKQLMLSITGGGSRAIASLLEVPGASATVIGAVVPYAAAALESWLGGPVDHFCSERTARAMAMTAFEFARKFSDADPHSLRGIGATASLATIRPKRGTHRVYVAWQSAHRTAALSCELDKGKRTRLEEEAIAEQLILTAVFEACEIEEASLLEPAVAPRVRRREHIAPQSWTELLLGTTTSVMISAEPPAATAAAQIWKSGDTPAVVFPGAFNPFHAGHERMAQIAAARYDAPVTFELSIANVDKPPLDFIELADRLKRLAGRPVLLTRAATFVEKANVAPGCVFVVGVDTLARIGETRYYGGDPEARDAAIASIADQGCRFLVFGRIMDDRFVGLSNLDVPAGLRELCEEVPEAMFRADISSTELRVR